MLLRRGREFDRKASLQRVALSILVLLALLVAGAQAPRWIAFAQDQETPVPPAVIADEAETPGSRAAGWPRSATFRSQACHTCTSPPAPPAPRWRLPLRHLPRRHPAIRYWLPWSMPATAVSQSTILSTENQWRDRGVHSRINQAGWGKLTPKELVNLRTQGVAPEYAGKMREAGLKDLSIREVIDLRMNGVRPEDLREIHSLGFGPYTTKESIHLWVNGVRPDLFRALKDAGFTHLEASEIIEAKVHGVSARNLREV